MVVPQPALVNSRQHSRATLYRLGKVFDLLSLLRRIYNWLAVSDVISDTDLIFAIAGRRSRKAYALELFAQGRAPGILLSTARFEIRRFSELSLPCPVDLLRLASPIPPPQRHFFVYFEGQHAQIERIPVERFGTLAEIRALATWLRLRPGITSVAIVSTGVHLRRVRLCCDALVPKYIQLRLNSVPNECPWLTAESWWRQQRARVLVVSELLKLPLYWLALAPFFIRRIGTRSE